MKVGSLFSGVGGFDLAFERVGMETVWQVEIDGNCNDVLGSHWPEVRRYHDITGIDGRELEAADLICGGFPCQDLSVAGRRAGLAGERSGLWFEFHRILAEHRPAWAVVENVPGLLSSNGGRDFAVILRGLVELGYGPAWRILDAQHFGVPQRRRRLFIVGHLGDYRAAQVLFEPESLRGDIAEGGEEGPSIADGTLSRSLSRVGGGDDPGANKGAALIFGPVGGGAYGSGRRTEDDPNLVAYPDPSYAVSAGQGGSKHGSGRHNQDTFVVAGTVAGAEAHNGNSNPIAENLVIAAPLRSRQHPNSNMPGRGGEDDENLVVGPIAPNAGPRSHDAGNFHSNQGGDAGHALPGTSGVRRLPPTECERLQGLPDGWTSQLSDSARYRVLGNAVCVPVVEWLGRRILEYA